MGGIDCRPGNAAGYHDCQVGGAAAGNAANFDGASSLTNTEPAVTSYAASFAAWFRSTTVDDHVVISVANGVGTDEFSLEVNSSGQAVIRRRSGATNSTAVTGSVLDGSYHFLVAVFASTTSGLISVDGGTQVEDTTSVAAGSLTRTRVGRSANLLNSNPATGDIDQALIYTSALTTAQITWLYNNVPPPTGRTYNDIQTSGDADNPGDTNLRTFWSLNEDDPGGIGNDEEGLFDLTIAGTVTGTDGIPAGD